MGKLVTTTELDLLRELVPAEDWATPGQLSHYDRLIYFWAGRKLYTGFGVIVDAGALVGGTARLMACGLSQNSAASHASILSYDLFEDAEGGPTASAVGALGCELPPPVNGIIDFEPLFRTHTAPYAHVIETRRGDISKLGYQDAAPIEILSNDVGKTPDLMLALARDFFPRLTPGRSFVLNEDYIFVRQPWVIMAMQALADCFALEYAAPTEVTVVHRLVKPITPEMVEQRLGREGRDYYTPERLVLIEEAVEALPSQMNKVVLRAAQIFAYWQFGLKTTARAAANQMLREHFLSADDIERKPAFKQLFAQIGVTPGAQ